VKHKTINFWIIACTALSCFTCQENTVKNGECEITTLAFVIKLPCAAQHKRYNSIDSNAGVIAIDSMKIEYDDALVPGTSVALTKAEYLQSKRWLGDLIGVLPLEKDSFYSAPDIFKEITFINLDTSSGMLKFSYHNKVYDYKVQVPEEIVSTYKQNVVIDGRDGAFYYSSEQPRRLKLFIYKPRPRFDDVVRFSFSVEDNKPIDTTRIMHLLKTIRFHKS
jgi:hypothetical protein